MYQVLAALSPAIAGTAVALVSFALISAAGRFGQGDPMVGRVE